MSTYNSVSEFNSHSARIASQLKNMKLSTLRDAMARAEGFNHISAYYKALGENMARNAESLVSIGARYFNNPYPYGSETHTEWSNAMIEAIKDESLSVDSFTEATQPFLSDEDHAIAEQEGWVLYWTSTVNDDEFWQLQFNEEQELFGSDFDAWYHVAKAAFKGSALHIRVLICLALFSEKEFNHIAEQINELNEFPEMNITRERVLALKY